MLSTACLPSHSAHTALPISSSSILCSRGSLNILLNQPKTPRGWMGTIRM